MKWVSFATIVLLATAAFAQQPEKMGTNHEPPMLGLHMAKGAQTHARRTSSPNLIYHNGPVQHGTTVQSIFWGSSWSSSDPKISAMESFYNGFTGTAYSNTNTEYTDTTGAHVSTALSVGQSIVDTSAAAKGSQTSTILAEVCRVITNPVSNGYYPVYTDLPRGGANYCAWHSWGSCNGVNVQFGFFWKLDGDPGCDPGDTQTGNSQPIAALANVTGHELSEMLTDPRGTGWTDSSGAENADKCAWTFNGVETFKNGTKWLIQGNWSNAAYNAGTGYTKGGCINGN